MKSLEIRKKFFDYFVKHGHEKVASSGLIPAQDPTCLPLRVGDPLSKFVGFMQSFKFANT